MIQLTAYKLLYVSRQTLLSAVEEVKDDQWYKPLPGLDESFGWVLGHYAAVEDWFLHHLNGVPYQLSDEWQTSYWKDTSGQVLTPDKQLPREIITQGFKTSRQRLLDALIWDLFHLNRCVKKGYFPPAVKTRGDAWLFISAHAYWHIGQINSLRGMLGYKYMGGKNIHH